MVPAVTSHSTRKPGFVPRAVNMEFVVDKVAIAQAFVYALRFSCQYHFTSKY
jgi:hypothetical protein